METNGNLRTEKYNSLSTLPSPTHPQIFLLYKVSNKMEMTEERTSNPESKPIKSVNKGEEND